MTKILKTFILSAVIIAQSLLTYANNEVWKVSKTGKAQFKSIQAAIDHIPTGTHNFIIIEIEAGVYNEKLFIK